MTFDQLIQWSGAHFRHLPWRSNRTLYTTLVSEIMLQQTTVGAVLHHFPRFLRQFPSIVSLANANEEEVRLSWKGLGYYRRAENLHRACQFFCKHYQGDIPLEPSKLLEAPGIGDYTASAILSIGADRAFLAVDANVERVLGRYFNLRLSKSILKKDLLDYGEKIFEQNPTLSPRAFNEALMDLGRRYCQAKKVDCFNCPLSSGCLAFQEGNPLEIPVVDKRKKITHELKLLRIISIENGKILVMRKKNKEWLKGQLELPTFILSSDDSSLQQYPWWENSSIFREFQESLSLKSSITKYKIENIVIEMPASALEGLGYQFSSGNELNELAVTCEKIVEKFFTKHKNAERLNKPDSVVGSSFL